MDISVASEAGFSSSFDLDGIADPDVRVGAIYASNYQRLVGLASLLTGGHATGEEIAQETFVIALLNERRKPGYLADPAWPWLRITAVRLAGRLRERLRRQVLSHLMQGEDTNASDAWGVETLDVVRALNHLPSKMRMCLILAYVEDQSTASIATMLSCSTQNVESQVRKGRERLRTLLGEGYDNG